MKILQKFGLFLWLLVAKLIIETQAEGSNNIGMYIFKCIQLRTINYFRVNQTNCTDIKPHSTHVFTYRT